MPMSNHVARQGHVILRTVLIALSIVVLAVCVLMWWVTVFGTAEPMANADGPASYSSPE
jgi:HAMP domain-containing protein